MTRNAGSPIPPQLDLELVVSGLDDPMIIANAGDGSDRLFFGDSDGHDLDLGPAPSCSPTRSSTSLGASQSSASEQGLLGLAFHPDYAVNGYFFVYYSAPDTTGNPTGTTSRWCRASRCRPGNANQADPTSELRRAAHPGRALLQPQRRELVFGPDGLPLHRPRRRRLGR